jgi:hypothetical protein
MRHCAWVPTQEFLAKDSLEDLVSTLMKGKVHNRLLDFFPPSKRTQEDFQQHLQVRRGTAGAAAARS